MADRDHRQWLEDEEERRAAHKGKHGHAPKASPFERAIPEEEPVKDRLQDDERRRLDDWTQDPIA